MRFWITVALLGLGACAGASPEPAVLDFDAHCRLTVEGFRESSPWVSTRLDTAAAWAVFPDVEDTAEECVHEGRLFRSGAAPRPVRLRCAAGPAAPAGVAYHALVVLDDAAVLERLPDVPFELTDALHVTPHDHPDPPSGPAECLVITSARGGLLFGAWPLRQVLELAGGE